VGRHRHTPEFHHILRRFSGKSARVVFTPHLVPMDRGILATTYARPRGEVTEEQVLDHLREFYRDRPFVRIVDHLPSTKDTSHTNYCDITVRHVDDWLLLIGAIDNLVKGASGAAVQNFNGMYGFPETTALY
jgi:N-acetyl-gamma-glutamyl-phosphate reductase